MAVRYRNASRRIRNMIQAYAKPVQAVMVNGPSTELQFREFLAKGYVKINVGGGSKNLDGFVNIDFVTSPKVKRQIQANILDLSFIPDKCIHHIHSNHVIEHLTDGQLRVQVREWKRILMPGGIVTIRCPNALGAAYGFWFEPILEVEKEEFVELGFPNDEDFGNPADRWMHRDLFGLLHWFYGDVGNITNQHLNLVTPSKLRDLLVERGFSILKMTRPEAVNIVCVSRAEQ